MIAPLQVSVDIFKGFPDEESIVNYTLNQAYQDNVTVFASEFLPLPHSTLLCSHSLPVPWPWPPPQSMSSHVSPFSVARFTLLPHSTHWLCLMTCPSVLLHLFICPLPLLDCSLHSVSHPFCALWPNASLASYSQA